jgi:hypothetical protein
MGWCVPLLLPPYQAVEYAITIITIKKEENGVNVKIM